MEIVIRAAVVYVFVNLVLRSLGKRELGELTAFELVLLFIIGDLVQQSITQNDTSITAALLAISTIALFIVVSSYVTFRWRRTRPVLEGTPVIVLYDGHIDDGALRRERMTREELVEAARRHGIADLGDVHLAVLETDGKLSFIAGGAGQDESEEHRAG